jgi:UDP-glucose 4-epimerase
MRVLVTGGAGFIGSHLVDALLNRGDEVALLDHLKRTPRPWFTTALARGARLHVADVRELTAVRQAFAAERPDVVLHLAAQVDVRRSVADPPLDVQVNVAGTVSVLEAAREVGVGRIVLASSAAAYGDPERLPTAEDAPIAPLSPYGTSKAAAEWYLAQYSRLYSVSAVALRMANVYGPRQDPHRESGVIAIFCGAAAERRPVTVFGDGAQTRDYVYVGDVVDAWITAAESDVTGAVNISTGTETTLLELVELLGVDHEIKAGRAGEIGRSCLDPGRAARELGWRPRVPLADGLRRTREALSAVAASRTGGAR